MHKHILSALMLLAGGTAIAANVTGDAERGKRIHSGEETIEGLAACHTCHGQDANQTISPTFPRLAGQYADYLVHALESYKNGTRNNAVMYPIASRLSERDMRDLAVYYQSLPGDLDDLTHLR
jgi:cytochrome c553